MNQKQKERQREEPRSSPGGRKTQCGASAIRYREGELFVCLVKPDACAELFVCLVKPDACAFMFYIRAEMNSGPHTAG